MPFDIEKNKDDHEAMEQGRWFDYEEGSRIKIAYTSNPKAVAKTVEISKRHGGQEEAKKPEILEQIIKEVIAEALVLDWQGFTKNGKHFPCTPENVRYVLDNSIEFTRFVNIKSGELRGFRIAEKAAEEKN